MTGDIRIGPIATAAPACLLDRAASRRVAELLTPAEVPRDVLIRLHDRIGIETRGVAILNPDGSIPLYGIAANPDESEPRRPTTAERMRAYADHAPPLAIEACTDALSAANLAPDRITHLVTASCTGFGAPGVDLAIIAALGLDPAVQRTHVGFMGCHAAVNAIRVAAAFARESTTHRVLVACVEISTVHFHDDARLDRVISNVLFADGAAALVVGVGDDSDDASNPTIAAATARVIPDSDASMAWHVGDHGFEMTLASDVPDRIGAALADWVDSTLDDHGLHRAEIGGWAIHPGGPRVIDAVARTLDLSDEDVAPSRAVLREHGNMSSPTLLHILQRLQSANVPRPWVALAFGPGLAGEMLLIR